ncbi:hypothetical protein [Lactococcus petauri]|uniref:hypothetical protein n=1 Tax=Lactococcus petauri TaxID=1940789 RepID=UPI00254D4820|nr:hypothetical protein [Lactococcus petauri]
MTLKEFLYTRNTEGSEHWDIEISTSTYKFKWKSDYGCDALNPDLLETVINNWGIEPKDSQIFVVL